MQPTRLEPRFVERVWGSLLTEPWFPNREWAPAIGEVWFDAGPLLIKFLFTAEWLSVQVHPDDAYAAQQHQGSRGKTEMWYVLDAEPGAKLAVGFEKRPPDARAAAQDGSIADYLQWHTVSRAQTYLAHAGTVHALGPGLRVLEIQQNSDVTYRLFDYGRPRELHLDHSLAVLDYDRHPGPEARIDIGNGGVRVAACAYFVTEQWGVTPDHPRSWDRASTVILIDGTGSIGGQPCRLGEVWQLPAGAAVEGSLSLLRTYEPA
ncbi:MAG: hypothetical protein FJW31_26700 [Acidobacteria bacterium]|nr:hypothetical protein [Acidobacteriota bacterium]